MFPLYNEMEKGGLQQSSGVKFFKKEIYIASEVRQSKKIAF